MYRWCGVKMALSSTALKAILRGVRSFELVLVVGLVFSISTPFTAIAGGLANLIAAASLGEEQIYLEPLPGVVDGRLYVTVLCYSDVESASRFGGVEVASSTGGVGIHLPLFLKSIYRLNTVVEISVSGTTYRERVVGFHKFNASLVVIVGRSCSRDIRRVNPVKVFASSLEEEVRGIAWTMEIIAVAVALPTTVLTLIRGGDGLCRTIAVLYTTGFRRRELVKLLLISSAIIGILTTVVGFSVGLYATHAVVILLSRYAGLVLVKPFITVEELVKLFTVRLVSVTISLLLTMVWLTTGGEKCTGEWW